MYIFLSCWPAAGAEGGRQGGGRHAAVREGDLKTEEWDRSYPQRPNILEKRLKIVPHMLPASVVSQHCINQGGMKPYYAASIPDVTPCA